MGCEVELGRAGRETRTVLFPYTRPGFYRTNLSQPARLIRSAHDHDLVPGSNSAVPKPFVSPAPLPRHSAYEKS